MFITDIKRVVEQVSRDKGIDREVLIKALEEALRSAARKKFGSKVDIEVQYNEETGEIEVFQFKEVVEKITEPEIQMTLEDGSKLDPDCEVGDSLGEKMDTTTFGRIAAQSAKQVIIQKMKDAERDAVFSSFIDRKGEIINGIVQRIERNNIIVNLGHTEGLLPAREQVPKETYRRGDRIRAYILDVLHDTRGPQIILSRTDPNFIINLFKTEVPEISEGIVNIMGAAREPGSRAKISVSSNDSDIDPVGACVGMKGSRVQNVVQELRGEKIDIIPWHADTAKFVCNALAPAEISRVLIDEEDRSMEVIVPDEFLSVAIGKRGQNVRLASKLTGWYLDVKSESRYSQAMKDGYDSLVKLPGIGISLADALYEKGFFSAEELSTASVQDLTQIRGIAEEKALKIIESAIEVMADEKVEESLSEETSADINDTTDIDDSEDQIIEEQPQPDMTTRNETSEESLSEKTPADINDTTDIDDSEGQIIEEQPKPDPTTRNETSEALAPSENSEAIKNDGARGTDTQKSSEENSG
ncbi:MAG: transcription termination factor NusA [Deltaproteobacteria bacterium]|nr:transcription termination factor NusA [Deltaproteobacteria bacterium]